MNKTYEQLRAKVYSIIFPDGIPLEFGVEVERLFYFKGGIDDYCDLEKGQIYRVNDDIWMGLYEARVEGSYKILGKPLELQSYLQAVKKGAYKNIKGVEFRHTKLGAVKTWKDDLPWVISLVKLDKKMWEQDEETLKKLLDLIS